MRSVAIVVLLSISAPAVAQTTPKAVKTLRVEAVPRPLYTIDHDGTVRIDWRRVEQAARASDLAESDLARALIAVRDGHALTTTDPDNR